MRAESPQRPAIRGAAGAVDISAEAPTRLAGFAGHRNLAAGVAQPLLASAVVFRGAHGRSQAIVSLDLLFAGSDLTQRLRAVALNELGMREHDLLVAASHTHFAPPVDRGKPALGVVDDAYLEQVTQTCCELLRTVAAKPMQPLSYRECRLRWEGAVYRRRHWRLPHVTRRGPVMAGIVRAPERRKPISRDVRLLELLDDRGSRVAVIWSASCHPSGFPEPSEQSPDYVGVVRDRLAAGPGGSVPVIFLQGFAGDLRPDAPDERSRLRRLARALAFGPTFGTFTPAGWREWADELATLTSEGLAALQGQAAASLAGDLGSALVALPLGDVIDGPCDAARAVEFQRLRTGAMCEIAAVSAEPSFMLAPLLGDPAIWPVGCCGDVFGYWPTDEQLREGGYEAGQWLGYFNLQGALRPGRDGIFRAAQAAASAALARDLHEAVVA